MADVIGALAPSKLNRADRKRYKKANKKRKAAPLPPQHLIRPKEPESIVPKRLAPQLISRLHPHFDQPNSPNDVLFETDDEILFYFNGNISLGYHLSFGICWVFPSLGPISGMGRWTERAQPPWLFRYISLPPLDWLYSFMSFSSNSVLTPSFRIEYWETTFSLPLSTLTNALVDSIYLLSQVLSNRSLFPARGP